MAKSLLKVKVKVKTLYHLRDTPLHSLFWDFAIFYTLWAGPVKWNTLYSRIRLSFCVYIQKDVAQSQLNQVSLPFGNSRIYRKIQVSARNGQYPYFVRNGGNCSAFECNLRWVGRKYPQFCKSAKPLSWKPSINGKHCCCSDWSQNSGCNA